MYSPASFFSTLLTTSWRTLPFESMWTTLLGFTCLPSLYHFTSVLSSTTSQLKVAFWERVAFTSLWIDSLLRKADLAWTSAQGTVKGVWWMYNYLYKRGLNTTDNSLYLLNQALQMQFNMLMLCCSILNRESCNIICRSQRVKVNLTAATYYSGHNAYIKYSSSERKQAATDKQQSRDIRATLANKCNKNQSTELGSSCNTATFLQHNGPLKRICPLCYCCVPKEKGYKWGYCNLSRSISVHHIPASPLELKPNPEMCSSKTNLCHDFPKFLLRVLCWLNITVKTLIKCNNTMEDNILRNIWTAINTVQRKKMCCGAPTVCASASKAFNREHQCS